MHISTSGRRLAAAAAIALIASASAFSASAQTFTRITDASNPVVTDLFESTGASWEDVNGDGLLDLFVGEGNLASQNDHIYLNLGGGAFLKVVSGPVVTSGGSSIGGAFGDWNADGRPDLFVSNRNHFGNFLYRGLGDTAFMRETGTGPGAESGDSNSASWLDLDGDGDLDLYVLNFNGPDFVYLNSGAPSWTLTRTLLPSIGNGAESSIHGAWGDVDDDGDLDQFVATGSGDDSLLVNHGGLAFAGRSLGDNGVTLGGSWGDFDQDGDLDLFAPHFLNTASILYRNDGPPAWALTPVSTAVFPNHVAFAVGSAWGDLDDDGDLDLLVANDNGQNESLYLNSGPPSFTFSAAPTGPLQSSGGNSFGCSLADLDRDGDLDVFVANRSNQANFLFRNDGPTGAWLAVRCRGAGANRDAIGARVRVCATIGGVPRWQMQQVLPISGYNSQNLELHFGLGDAGIVDSLEVRWPDGTVQRFGPFAANQRIEPRQGGATAVGDVASATHIVLAPAGANPCRGPLRVALTLPRAADVEIALVDVQGRLRARTALGRLAAGRHTHSVAASLEPGLYWARATASGTSVVAAMVVVR